MQVSNPNNVKIYNLSAGRSLPEWLSDRKKRNLQKQDVDIRRRIDLIQDFSMPTVSNSIQVSKDQQYIFATGVYKPTVKCFDVNNLSLKFERCFDCEIVKFKILSEDYSKLVFLQSDRYIEFHAQHGKYYRTRIPKFGRDFSYHENSCDLYFVGASSEIYRLNLEQGRFLNSLKTNATEINCGDFNPVHDLYSCGTKEGRVESWDPRVRRRVGLLDCAISTYVDEQDSKTVPSVTCLKYKDALTMGVGTSTGQILMYDMRSDKPLLVKDHNYGLPIKDLEFHDDQDLVLSCDSRILKLWERQTGKPFTSIEPGVELNDLCVFPNTGLFFLANEAPKMQTYYIPSLGPAPKWCGFLDSLTEELEENPAPSVYDDYKFVTRTELDGLGLIHLIGSNLLRAYMHGYFIDVRLFHKAKSLTDPFAYEDYKKSKIREKIEESRTNRVQVKKLPKVNRQLAEKLLDQAEDTPVAKKKKKEMPNLMEDSRFSSMFSNPAFQVDTESEDYRLLNPLVSKLDRDRNKRQKQEALKQQFDEVEEADEVEGRASSDDDSSDDDHTWTQEMKVQHRKLQQEARQKRRDNYEEASSKPKFYELKTGQEAVSSSADNSHKKKIKLMKRSLGDRAQEKDETDVIRTSGVATGAMEMTYTLKKKENETETKWRQQAREHHQERRKIRRSAGGIIKPKPGKPKFYMGKRVQ